MPRHRKGDIYMELRNGPIILGTIVMEKLGAVNFEHAFLSEYGCIEVVVDQKVEEAIKKETNFYPLYTVIDVDDPEKGTWELTGGLEIPRGMVFDYPTHFSFHIPDSEITLALNILCYGLDEPHVRKSLEQWAVKRLAMREDHGEEAVC